MMAAFAFEPIVCASLQVGRPQAAILAVWQSDPALTALVREIRRIEGEPVAEPPMLFRLVEIVGFGIIGICVAGLVSGFAALVA